MMQVSVRAYHLQTAVDKFNEADGHSALHLLTALQDGMLKYACDNNSYVLVDEELFNKLRDFL